MRARVNELEYRTRKLLIAAFGIIIAFVLVDHAVAYVQSAAVRDSIGLIENDALSSIELAGRMGIDVERERNLIARHIFERATQKMAEIEQQIEVAKHDFAIAASAYGPLASFPGEAEAWHRLTADVARTDAPTAAALDLSRKDRDVDATAMMSALEPVFDTIARDVNELIAINRAAATGAAGRISELQSSMLWSRLGLAAAVLIITLSTGMWVTRKVLRMQRQLTRQREELEVRNRELDSFAGRVAHDLRGPLNTLSLSASIIAERAPGENATTAIMRKGIAQMTNLVEDLLGLSRVGIAPSAVAPVEPITRALESELGELVKQAGGTLHVDVQPAVVRGSPGLLRQVLWNLGENAVKYRRAEAPPAIEIVGRSRDGRYELVVYDNGTGIPRAELHHVFEPFYRCERSKTLPGTGLGLAIVRRIVEASGGSISVDSEPGRGTAFKLVLPLVASRDARLDTLDPANDPVNDPVNDPAARR